MRTKKNLMLQLTIVSFALNIVSIFLTILQNTHTKISEIEKTAYQKHKALIDTRNFINDHDSLVGDFSGFPRNIVT